MRIIAVKNLKEFWERHPQAKNSLKSWHDETKKANWNNTQDIKKRYIRADFLKNNRVIFDISGNRCRLVVEINYNFKIVFIKFIGTHKEYEEIDPEMINEY
ncbi:type II toxin-antitoxin system HigB family toxin [Candidatus Nucleicultrix amoebiphila]|jgi:mRNA interferase HigB|uniref:Toxin RelE n=1 Tax=Candidatus Nucleicultrix amoebiphila FS5 TaxID=1414854 RepID=A0A1W6N4X0_9PROT|nr:type II toxin-antitoxin system HigB family toxin [Candidatus Nucleicultrix amoebiphila]ARN84806.1 hypothetical protein GQ61_05330 [Candidatus Nucleicultrix amoebiphila FS5]